MRGYACSKCNNTYNCAQKSGTDENTQTIKDAIRADMAAQNSDLRRELVAQTQSSIKNMGEMIAQSQRSFSQSQAEKSAQIEERLKTFSLENEQKLDNIRKSVN